MGFLKKLLGWAKDKSKNFAAAIQAGRARDLAADRSNKQMKRGKSRKKSYKPGTLGLSLVSAAIKKDYGSIVSRKERKRLAKLKGVTFKAYTIGETTNQRPSAVLKQLWKSEMHKQKNKIERRDAPKVVGRRRAQ